MSNTNLPNKGLLGVSYKFILNAFVVCANLQKNEGFKDADLDNIHNRFAKKYEMFVCTLLKTWY